MQKYVYELILYLNEKIIITAFIDNNIIQKGKWELNKIVSMAKIFICHRYSIFTINEGILTLPHYHSPFDANEDVLHLHLYEFVII